MKTDLFDYQLPEKLIAQTPAEQRDQSRLLVYRRSTGSIAHHIFTDLPDLLPAPMRIYRNNAAVIKARIRTRRATGGAAEILLLRPSPPSTNKEEWQVLLKPAKKLPIGAELPLGDTGAKLTVLSKAADGTCRVAFDLPETMAVTDLADQIGEMPLPPYIQRQPHDSHEPEDIERYQTVFADRSRKVAAAAPTAGLHFTPAVLEQLEKRGHHFHDLTLHVGLGTFKPVTAENIEEHPIHTEFYEIPPATLASIENKDDTALRLAIGTTSLRTLEDYAKKRREGTPPPPPASGFQAEADIFITPPAEFFGADALLTNFHLPRSTLLALVSAFISPGSTDGIQRLKELYNEAINEDYRFFSYGDAMLILP